MAYYALLNQNNIVEQVITGLDENQLIEGLDPETWYSQFTGKKCKRTSYNTYGGKHKDKNKQPFRKNYAGIGYYFDESEDAFIPPKPYPSFKLNKQTGLWEAPKAKPNDEFFYYWDEETQEWIKFENI